MNVLLVHSQKDSPSPDKPLASQEEIPLGLAYIGAYLKAHEHRTEAVVLSRGNREVIFERVGRFRPGLVCFSAVATEYRFLAEVAAEVKRRRPEAFLLAGGVHVSLNAEECLSDVFDGLCIGEGEEPTVELAGQLERGEVPAGIRNLWMKRGDGVEKNPTRPFLENLDALPFPDRGIFQEWIRYPSSRSAVLLARGCPFRCTYCCNEALRELASGRYVRHRSPANIVQEIRQLGHRFPERDEIYLEVETLTSNVEWALELCGELERLNGTLERRLSFGANIRVTQGAKLEELFGGLERAGFRFIKMGLESGSERLRREVLKRDYSNEDVVHAVTLAREHGLQVAFYNMVGLPGESLEEFGETVRVNRTCQPDWLSCYIFFPYAGTELYRVCRERGLLKGMLDVENERYKPVLDLPGFSKKQIKHEYVWFSYKVYKGHRPFHKLLYTVFANVLQSNYRLARVYDLTDRGVLKKVRTFLRKLCG